MRGRGIILLMLLLLPAALRAQIFTQGSDTGCLRWMQMETPYYKVIYPVGTDSLARVYGTLLEQYRVATGRSIGGAPGEFSRGKIPVILHTHFGIPNASMFWAPRRMDVFTVPDPYGGDPTPWERILTTHEPRHAAQLQPGYRGKWKWINYLVGEVWPAAVWALYPSQALSEGDAVVFETATTLGGRARTADFLNYYRVAFDQGDFRNWYRWRYGSYRYEASDYYGLGYLTVAGMRYFYDDPLYMKDYFDSVLKHPLRIGHMQKTAREASGKRFKETFSDITAGFNALWQAEAASRAPFLEPEQITPETWFATDYTDLTNAGPGCLYAVRSGKTTAPRLVRFQDGREQDMGPFPSHAGSLFYDPVRERIYWSETVSDRRWTLASTSRIRYVSTRNHRQKDLTTEGRLYNPQPSLDGNRLAVVEYPWEGGSRVLEISADDGTVLRRHIAPDGVQATESAWMGDTLYVFGVAEEGSGLWRITPDGVWSMLLAPSVQKVTSLDADGDCLTFVSDRNGANELYSFCPSTGELRQRTSLRYGGEDFVQDGDMLYLVSQTLSGKKIFRLGTTLDRPVRYEDVRPCPVEETITAQELALGPLTEETNPAAFSEPRPYRKFPRLFRIHSWAPVYFDYDQISSLSLDLGYEAASLGATALFQNDLGTSEGYIGYGAHPDPETTTPWRHSFHAKWTYTGLYPVIEASVSLNDEASRQYNFLQITTSEEQPWKGSTGYVMAQPLAVGSLSVYLPLNFSKGGVSRGIIPRLSWSVSNNRYQSGAVRMDHTVPFPGAITAYQFLGSELGANAILQSLSGSLRAYSVLPRGESQVYPRLGIGAEGGFRLRPGLSNVFAPAFYTYLYGYLPGFTPVQGWRLTALSQAFDHFPAPLAENAVSITPRGFSSSDANYFAAATTAQLKLTADYAIPFWAGDLSFLSPVLYIKNFLAVPHVDVMFCTGGEALQSGVASGLSLISAGVDLTAELGNLLWFPFDCSVGVSLNWLGGPHYGLLEREGLPLGASLIFSMDI